MAKDPASNTGASLFEDVPVVLTISVGRARAPIGELLTLGKDSVLPLDSRVDDPVVIRAGERVVAFGELQALDGSENGQLAVRITRLASSESGD